MDLPRPARWRAFASPRYRAFHAIAVGQAFSLSFASDALFVPLLLRLGAPPSFVILVGAMPIAGTALQALVPEALRRMAGDLRRLTLLLTLAEIRGFVFAAIVAAAAAGAITPAVAIVLVAATVGIGQTLGYLSGSNITLWTAVVLGEEERRLVGPRMGAMTMALSTVLLVPAGFALDAASRSVGLWAYVALFALGGAVATLSPLAVRRLPRPGRVRVSTRNERQTGIPASFDRFTRASTIGAFGQGVLPYLSLYAMHVLGASAGFALVLSGVATAGALAGSLLAGSFLLGGSASRVLRASFVVRAIAAGLCVVSLPGNPAAGILLCTGAALFYGGGNAGVLASNERLYRLAPPEARIRCQGRYVGSTSAAAAGGTVVCAVALAVTVTPAFAAYTALYVLSGLSRSIAAIRLEVSPSWRSPVRVAEPPLVERRAPDRPFAGERALAERALSERALVERASDGRAVMEPVFGDRAVPAGSANPGRVA